jgi:hypothetical protein
MLEVLLFIILAGGLTGLSFFFQIWSNQKSNLGKQFPTPQEVAQQERERAQREREIAQQERGRSQKLAAKLRELGVDPDDL